jgi:ornithine decarboxylase
VGMLGAYGCAMRTEFNGFGDTEDEVVVDEPMASLYARVPANDADNIVQFEKRSAQ